MNTRNRLYGDLLRRLRKYLRRLRRLEENPKQGNYLAPKRRFLRKRIERLSALLKKFLRPAYAAALGSLIAALFNPLGLHARTPQIETLVPAANAIATSATTDIAIDFNVRMNVATLTAANISIYASQTGYLSAKGVFSGNPERMFASDAAFFKPGEKISVTVFDALSSAGAPMNDSYVYSFLARSEEADAAFTTTKVGNGDSRDLALGDLDGDGDLDAFIARYNTQIQLWLNNGDSKFIISSLGTAGAKAVDLGDLDNDGDLDAVFVYLNSSAQIFINNGDATFASAAFGAGTTESRGIALGDLDGDGDLDALIANDDGDANDIWFNNGDGSFTSTSFGSWNSTDVALGDLDGDGDLDALFANRIESDVTWFNNGDGSFTTATVNGDFSTNGVALGDLDGDGDLDAIRTRNGTNFIGKNDGSGNFANSQFGSSSHSTGVAIGDLDGDGDLDAVITNHTKDFLWLNNGDATFVTSEIGQNTVTSYAADVGDLDGDGSLDVLVVREGREVKWLNNSESLQIESLAPAENAIAPALNSDISIEFNLEMDAATLTAANISIHGSQTGYLSTSGVFSGNTERSFTPNLAFEPGELISVSVTGAASVFGAPQESSLVYSFLALAGKGDAVFASSEFGLSNSSDVEIGDLDGDGDLDAFVSNFNGKNHLWLNNGDASFNLDLLDETQAQAVDLGDLDNDGDLDAIFVYENSSPIIFINNGDASFATSTFGVSTRDSESIALGDLDGDGDLDLIIANESNQANDIWFNNGDGSFTSTEFGDGNSQDLALGDLDGDGDLDAVFANRNEAHHIWFNNGDGSFSTASYGDGSSEGLALGDLDGDGDLDLVLARSGSNQIGINDGSGTFTTSNFGTGTSRDAAIGDLDGDKDLDVFIVNNGEHHLWLNNGDASFASSTVVGNATDSYGVALGDLDDNGSLDVIVAQSSQEDILLNKVELQIESLTPAANAIASSATAAVSIEFSLEMDTASVTAANIAIYGSQTGYLSTSGSYSGNPLRSFAPNTAFKPGEKISVSVIEAESAFGVPLEDPLVYSFLAPAGQGGAVFTTFGQGLSTSMDVALGDLDKDGDLDALVVNFNSKITLWRNNGDGSFATSNFVTRDAMAVDLGDLDNDGDLDAIVAFYDIKQRILLNNGDATFKSTNFGLTLKAEGVAIGDLNGDGFLDAVVANANGNTDEIWINNGDGSFTSSSFGAGKHQDVALGDLDGDGDLDAVFANIAAAHDIWLNNGDGAFSTATFGSGSSEGVALGDLNGDGHLDLVLARNGGNIIGLNDGSGNFTLSTFGGGSSRAASIGDLDGDGDLDVVFANEDASHFWLNNGDATFVSSSIGNSNEDSNGVDLGDLDNDGILDVFIARKNTEHIWFSTVALQLESFNPEANAVAAPRNADIEIGFNQSVDIATLTSSTSTTQANLVVYGMQTGHLTTRAAIGVTDGFNTVVIDPEEDFLPGEEVMVSFRNIESNDGQSLTQATVYGFRAAVEGGSATFISGKQGDGTSQDIALGDLDGDGDLDAIVANFLDEAQDIWLNNGDGSFATSTFGAGESTALALGDLDGDGDLDAVIVNADFGSPAQEIWLNNGDGSFATATFGGGDTSTDVALGDLDGDGDLDAIVTSTVGGQEIWLNKGDGSFSSSSFGANGSAVALGDLDGDGDLDAVLTDDFFLTHTNYIWLNNGDASFSSSSFGDGLGSDVDLGDLDGDGDLDAVIAYLSDPNSIWLNNGDGSFASSEFGRDEISHGAALGDLDGDGDLDAIFTNTGYAAQDIWLNNGDGSFSSSTFGAGESTALALGDLDGDGDLDAIIADSDEAQHLWFNIKAPAVTSLTPNTTSASLSGMQIELAGLDFESTTASLSTLDADGKPEGTLNLSSLSGSRKLLRADIPPGYLSTAGTLTLTVCNSFGATTSTLTVLNDQPRITVTNASVTSDEDVPVIIDFGLSDIWPGVDALLVTPPTADLVTVASITQLGSTAATTQFIVTPVTNASGIVALTFNVSDGELTHSTSLTLEFLAVNDAPIIATSNTAIATDEDKQTTTTFSLTDVDTPYTNILLSATSSNTSLVTTGGISFDATGATTSFSIDPIADANGNADITITVDDGVSTSSTTFTLTVNPINDAPLISTSNTIITTDEDKQTSGTFSLSDIETPFANLLLSATSSNLALVTTGGISFGATATTTSFSIDPVGDANGSANITITVDDGVSTSSTTFTLTVNPVNDPPEVSVTNLSVTSAEDASTTLSVRVDDIDTVFSNLLLSATSSNLSLVTTGGISFGATAATTSFSIDPVADANGSADITITVDDGVSTNSTTFTLTVNPVNDPPLIATSNTAIATKEDNQTSGTFSLSDIDTPFTNLLLSATSSNLSLVTTGGISFGATAATTSFTLDPLPSANGTALMTITVDDGVSTSSTTFTLTVNPINDPPLISTSNTAIATDEDEQTSGTFSLSDIDTPFTNLLLSATSSNLALVTTGGISFGTTGATTNFSIDPVADANGSALITVHAFDGEFTRSTSFTLTVNPVNDPPTIEAATSAVTGKESASTTNLISISDIDTALPGLFVTATSANQALMPDGALLLSATAATMQLMMHPACGQSGSALITVSVNDGEFIRRTSFSLEISAVTSLSISGVTEVCPNLVMRYTAEPADASAAHTWTIDGGSIVAGQNTAAVDVIWNSGASGSLCVVRSSNIACTTSSVLPVDLSGVAALIDFAAISQEQTVTLAVLNNDGGAGITLISVDDPSGGQASATKGIVSYTPAAGFTGVDQFNYNIEGTDGCRATGAIVVAVASTEASLANIEYIDREKDRVNGVRGLRTAYGIAVTPDGRFVYAAGRNDHSIAIFERNMTSGSLSYRDRVRHGSGGVTGLKYVSDLAISPDGAQLFAAGYGNNSVVVFDIDELSGALTFVERIANGQMSGAQSVTPFKGPRALAVSPDGKTIYIDVYVSHALAVFNRLANGSLEFLEMQRDGVNGVDGLRYALDVAISPDGKSVYAAGYGDHALAVFRRNLTTGSLTFIERVKDGVSGVDGLAGAASVALSPDGQYVYAAGKVDNAIAVFRRASSDGSLSFVKRYKDNLDGVNGLAGVCALALSPDGRHLWAAGANEDAVALFARDAATGELSWLAIAQDGINGVDGLDQVLALTVDPASEHVYGAGFRDNALAALLRNRAPEAVHDNAGNTLVNATMVISPLGNDSDPDGHSLNIRNVSGATLGALTISGGGTTIDYDAGAAPGADSFEYTIEDGHGGSSTATVSVAISAAKQGIAEAPAFTLKFECSPNPIRDAAEIHFNLNETMQLRLSIRDLSGRAAAMLAEGEFDSGAHRIMFKPRLESGARLAAGSYLLVLEEIGGLGLKRRELLVITLLP